MLTAVLMNLRVLDLARYPKIDLANLRKSFSEDQAKVAELREKKRFKAY